MIDPVSEVINMLLPATPAFTLSGFGPVTPKRMDPKVAATLTGDVRHGTRGGPPDVRILGGYFVFDSSDAVLLVSLLPALIHVRGAKRLSTLERLIGEESTDQRAGRLTPQHKLSVTRLLRGFAANARVLGRVIPRQRCLTRTA